MTAAFRVRDRLVKAALVVLATLAPLALAVSCSTAPAPASDPESGQTPGCANGLDDCGGACVDVRSNLQNCGMCGTVCAPGLFCSLGACSDSCAATLTVCAGLCVDVLTSASHCGGCGIVCAGGLTCSAGVCSGSGTGGSGSGTGGSGSGGSAGTGGTDGGTASGYQIGATCFPACANATTDPDDAGVSDGYGYESGRSCIVPGE